ncbi:addiction module toxin, HicA family [Paenibacillus faecis]|uniref:Addiction module toxin, HicA family n=1 Tax=Paenibacillus faecis TaxID=862114 RepID=A0A5D0CNI3_9BACL|nr:type II toxin-antitoxin system HicA family toxin [Paenibacillus faecis]TYA10805.1 addiction module toxin, HicA family [Paenibacillus faecis]
MKGLSSREVIKIIEADGWYYIRATGDRYQFKHPRRRRLIYERSLYISGYFRLCRRRHLRRVSGPSRCIN